MKMRQRRKCVPPPREYTLGASVRCEPYRVDMGGGFSVPMDTRRIHLKFKMQHATHTDCIRKIMAASAKAD